MSDLVSDGNVRVSFCSTIANIHAPTTTELNAGTALESYITPNGLNDKATTASVDTSALSSTFGTATAGRRSFDISIEFKRQTPAANDVAYNLLPYKTSGYLVIRRTLPVATAYASTQTVEVYPVITGEPELSQPAANEVQKFTSNFFLTSDPDTRAVIA